MAAHPRAAWRYAAGLTLGGAMALPCLGASPAPTLAACDGPFATTLQAAPASDARAYWLDRQTMLWPGTSASDGVFKLYYASTPTLSASKGAAVRGAEAVLPLNSITTALPAALAQRFRFVAKGAQLQLAAADSARLPQLLTGQLMLVLEGADGKVRDATSLQIAGALDDLYASAAEVNDLGVSIASNGAVSFKLWAPTAQQVAVCTYASGTAAASSIQPMQRDNASGVWSLQSSTAQDGQYYRYVVDVIAPSTGLVRNLVTDPYSVSLTTDSRRSYIADLNAPRLKPAGWEREHRPKRVYFQPDMTVYELHVRDFSINDASVSAAKRGKYAAFTESTSNGMQHLAALAQAGMTDIHLLPVFDIGSVPEQGCITPQIPAGLAPDNTETQANIARTQASDCYNWGYDPYHYSAPEGSFASDPANGATRIIEFRQMVQALHKAGLRVGMDVVYNHTFIAGQNEKSVLDRIVPGYYHRLNGNGAVERSTCCDNTATENRMMGKLMIDSVALWAQQYHIDSFRFDLMGHQPRAAMEQLQLKADRAAGRHINLIGEGWNFGEVADGARFVQASQLSLNGSGIGTFSDRARDAVRGGGAGDSGLQMISQQGYINGLVYDNNAQAGKRSVTDLLQTADMVRVGLAGSIRSYPMRRYDDSIQPLQNIVYGGNQPAGYASEPDEVVNYVENHDNQTLYDINAFKLPTSTSSAERARVQMLGAAINAFSQGVAYFHAGFDILRSKSLDRNSFESGDWFNRLDWSYQDNYYGVGAPRAEDNGKDYDLILPLLRNSAIKPTPKDIAFARDAFRDLLRIRSSSTLFRLRSAAEIRQRLSFYNTGSQQVPTVLVGHLEGAGYAGAQFRSITYLINVDTQVQKLTISEEKNRHYQLHPVHTDMAAADKRVASEARFDASTGSFVIPPRSAVVFVETY
ncbi:pullulanase-type alpha-1,6-glucosidase [Pseudoduganella danionis]|uniref:pullulanase-type alpha-1,6-glucosidase n=1 Tax=Pseudoduganella danionis TaxID=1890295 RepID=UPI0035B24595